MGDSYEINGRGEVVPYSDGRMSTDTRTWRDATELELQQRDEIERLEAVNTELLEALESAVEWDGQDDCGEDAVWFDRACFAIAKARGEK